VARLAASGLVDLADDFPPVTNFFVGQKEICAAWNDSEDIFQELNTYLKVRVL